MILDRFHGRKSVLWKLKKFIQKHKIPKNLYFPSHLVKSIWLWECFPSVLDVLWDQLIYLKVSTESREHVRNNFGKIKNDLAPIIIGWRIEFFDVRVGILKYHTWGRRYINFWDLVILDNFFWTSKVPFSCNKIGSRSYFILPKLFLKCSRDCVDSLRHIHWHHRTSRNLVMAS